MKKTAEAVSLGHPDKTADYISSYILDRMIAQDEQVKYTVEVMVKDNTVVLAARLKAMLIYPIWKSLLRTLSVKLAMMSFTPTVGEIMRLTFAG